jgi:hypothetical protein
MNGNGPLVEPPTTRIGGGGSAHAVAIGVVVVLVALVWVGWSGRPGPPGAAPLASGAAAPTAVAAGISPTPAAATSGPADATAEPRPSGWQPVETARPSVSLAEDVYAITAGFSGAGGGSMLREVERGHLQATLEMPSAGRAMGMTVELHQLSSVGMPNSYVQLGSWDLSEDEFVPDTPQGSRVLDDRVEAQAGASNPSLLVRRGFTIQVHAATRGLNVDLLVDIKLLPMTRRPADEDHRIFP